MFALAGEHRFWFYEIKSYKKFIQSKGEKVMIIVLKKDAEEAKVEN